jgi:hypothetical protein
MPAMPAGVISGPVEDSSRKSKLGGAAVHCCQGCNVAPRSLQGSLPKLTDSHACFMCGRFVAACLARRQPRAAPVSTDPGQSDALAKPQDSSI